MIPSFGGRAVKRHGRLLALLALLPIAGCETVALLTPTAFPDMPAAATAPATARVYYVTDRNASPEGGRDAAYGHERSASMAFGQVELGFDKLAVDSDERAIRVRAVSEQLRFPETPLPVSAPARRGAEAGERAGYEAAARDFQTRVAQALRTAGRDEVVLFVHGYNNDFEDAVAATANIWQATSGSMVPIAYTWPADNPGLFGYFKDRESGEFSIFHLKETLRLLSGVPGLRKIQLVAHSRGTDVATTALREMIIAARAAGHDPRATLKIDNLILAAPDLDFGVVRQRLIAERFGAAFECITVYMNPSDSALGLAQAINSGTRFGRLTYADLDTTERDILNQIGNIYFIDVSGVVDPRGHSYFRDNPVVLSDIVTLLHTGENPGGPNRALSHTAANFWMLEQFPEVTFEPVDR